MHMEGGKGLKSKQPKKSDDESVGTPPATPRGLRTQIRETPLTNMMGMSEDEIIGTPKASSIERLELSRSLFRDSDEDEEEEEEEKPVFSRINNQDWQRIKIISEKDPESSSKQDIDWLFGKLRTLF